MYLFLHEPADGWDAQHPVLYIPKCIYFYVDEDALSYAIELTLHSKMYLFLPPRQHKIINNRRTLHSKMYLFLQIVTN